MAAKRVVEDGRSLRRLVAMRLDIAVSIDIVLPAREQRDPIEELERERRIAAFGDKATDAVRDLDMLERIVGALGDILIFDKPVHRSEEHTSELQSLMRISYAVFCLKKKKTSKRNSNHNQNI